MHKIEPLLSEFIQQVNYAPNFIRYLVLTTDKSLLNLYDGVFFAKIGGGF